MQNNRDTVEVAKYVPDNFTLQILPKAQRMQTLTITNNHLKY